MGSPSFDEPLSEQGDPLGLSGKQGGGPFGLFDEGGIFGNAPQVENVTPNRFNLPGMRVARNGRTINVSRGGEVESLLQSIRSTREQQAESLRNRASGLEENFGPAIERLTDVRRRIMDAERQRTMSDLREQLGRRRVLGSSFGTDALARAGAEFALREAETEAEGELLELEKRTDLFNRETEMLNQAFQAEIQGIIPELEQLGMERQLAADLTNTMFGANQEIQRTNEMLKQAHGRSKNEFAGTMIGAMSRVAASMFGGGGGGGSAAMSFMGG